MHWICLMIPPHNPPVVRREALIRRQHRPHLAVDRHVGQARHRRERDVTHDETLVSRGVPRPTSRSDGGTRFCALATVSAKCGACSRRVCSGRAGDPAPLSPGRSRSCCVTSRCPTPTIQGRKTREGGYKTGAVWARASLTAEIRIQLLRSAPFCRAKIRESPRARV